MVKSLKREGPTLSKWLYTLHRVATVWAPANLIRALSYQSLEFLGWSVMAIFTVVAVAAFEVGKSQNGVGRRTPLLKRLKTDFSGFVFVPISFGTAVAVPLWEMARGDNHSHIGHQQYLQLGCLVVGMAVFLAITGRIAAVEKKSLFKVERFWIGVERVFVVMAPANLSRAWITHDKGYLVLLILAVLGWVAVKVRADKLSLKEVWFASYGFIFVPVSQGSIWLVNRDPRAGYLLAVSTGLLVVFWLLLPTPAAKFGHVPAELPPQPQPQPERRDVP